MDAKSLIQAGSMRNGGMTSKPIMDLVFECQVFRDASRYTGAGSKMIAYTLVGGPVPCDVQPLTDTLALQQVGQTEVISHVIHLPAGTDVQERDAITILSSRTGFGPVGLSFYVKDLLLPSETISFVRCRVRSGEEPTTGAF